MIVWPARARDLAAPSYAGAARVVFPNSGASNSDVSQVVVRPAGSAAVTQSVLLDFAVSPGAHLVRVEFLSDAAGSVPLATASLNVRVGGDGGLSKLDGSALGTVAYAARITGLALAPGQTVEVGAASDLVVTATTDGGVVALRPGAVRLTSAVDAGLLGINPDGSVVGLSVGTVDLIASVEGVTSAPTAVNVLPAPTTARVVSLATNAFVADSTRGLLWTATPAGAVRSVDPATGALGAPIAVGSNPTVLALSDDGTTLYAGLQASGSVRKVDLTSNAAGLQFTIPNTGFGGAGYANDLAVQPGHPNTLALTTQEFNSSGNNGPEIFDDGVKRPNGLGIYQGTRLLFTAADRLVAYDTSSTDDTLRGVTVDAQGATLAQSVPSGLNSFGTRFVLAGGRLYDRGGVVFDAASLTRLGAFDLGLTGGFSDAVFGPAVDGGRAYFVVLSGGTLRVLAFDSASFALTGSRRIAGVDSPSGDRRAAQPRQGRPSPGPPAHRPHRPPRRPHRAVIRDVAANRAKIRVGPRRRAGGGTFLPTPGGRFVNSHGEDWSRLRSQPRCGTSLRRCHGRGKAGRRRRAAAWRAW